MSFSLVGGGFRSGKVQCDMIMRQVRILATKMRKRSRLNNMLLYDVGERERENGSAWLICLSVSQTF